mgnify:CR=1 FL=1
MNVKEWWDNTGYSIPWFYDAGGQYVLFIGSKNGHIHYYKDIDANINGAFTQVDTTFFEEKEGIRSACTVSDVTADGFIDMFTGNYRGGLTFYMGKAAPGVGISEIYEKEILLYPNPANDNITITGEGIAGMNLKLTDISGKTIYAGKINADRYLLNLGNVSNGVYFIQLSDKDSSVTQKFIKAGN